MPQYSLKLRHRTSALLKFVPRLTPTEWTLRRVNFACRVHRFLLARAPRRYHLSDRGVGGAWFNNFVGYYTEWAGGNRISIVNGDSTKTFTILSGTSTYFSDQGTLDALRYTLPGPYLRYRASNGDILEFTQYSNTEIWHYYAPVQGTLRKITRRTGEVITFSYEGSGDLIFGSGILYTVGHLDLPAIWSAA